MTETDYDLTVIENLDWQPVCECYWHEDGVMGTERPPAEWVLDTLAPCKCGPKSKFVCTPCAEEIPRWHADNDYCACPRCGVITPMKFFKYILTRLT